MAMLSLTLSDAELARLAVIAAREGLAVEDMVAAVLQAWLEADEAADLRAALEALEAAPAMNLDQFGEEMDAFIAALRDSRD